MQTNRVKAMLRDNKAVSGPIIGEIRSIGGVKLMAHAGFDFLFLDMEHAMYNWETILQLVQTALLCDICPLVRPTDNIYGLVARALDSGAQGVIIPRVQDRQAAEDVIQFTKYPPIGRRGAGGDGRNAYLRKGVLEAIETANDESLVVVQIESVEAVDRIDEIASVDGVDVMLIGPQDLSISLGCHGDFTQPDFLAAAKKVAEAGKKYGKATGMVEKDAANLERWYDMGMRFLVCSSDSYMLSSSAARDVQVLKEFSGA
jgi:2-dehydro-3-deoxyglucarate aldolase/4-hydroxy-2-oxoheptanedioate aldolase